VIENSFETSQSFRNGLAPETEPRVNTPYMVRTTNVIPSESGWRTAPVIARPGIFDTGPKEFPFPMAFKGDSVRLYLHEDEVYTLNSSFAVSGALTKNLRAGGTTTIGLGSAWHCETFLDMFWATNGSSLVYKIPSDDGDMYVDNALTVQAIARHDYRVLFGGMSGAWFAGSRWATVFNAWRDTHHGQLFVHDGIQANATYVVWSEGGGGSVDVPFYAFAASLGLLGDSVFDTAEEVIADAVERGEIGLQPIRKVSTIRQMKQLGNRVIVYGDNSISELRPIEGGFQEELIADFGVGGRTCVGGDTRGHLIVSNDGQIYTFFANQDAPERQGYRQYLSDLSMPRVVVSFDPVERYFWITDGWECYVYTRTGLGGPMNVRPSCLFRDDAEGLVGVYTTPTTLKWSFETSKFDMAERDFKHISAVQLHGSNFVVARARIKGNYQVGGREIACPWAQFGPHGVSYPSMSFIEASIECEGWANDQDVDCTNMEVRYHQEGKAHKRGTSGISGDA
jgi:hypothetical protein